MNDLSIRVSATDMASNVLAAVGENVKTLGQSASNSFNQMANSSQNAANSVGGTSDSLMILAAGPIGGVVKALATVTGAAFAASAAVAGIAATALAAAIKAERELDKIADSLALIDAQKLKISVDQVSRDSINQTTDDIKKLVEQIELATNIKSSRLMGVAGDAVKMGFDPRQIDQTIKAAAGLSAAMGISVEEGLSKVKLATQGTFDSFKNLIPGIESLTTAEEKLAAVSKLAADGLLIAAENAESSGNIFARASLGLGNFFERLGNGTDATRLFAGVMQEIILPIIDLVDQNFISLGDTSEWLANTLKEAFAFAAASVDVSMNSTSSILQRTKLQWMLFSEQVSSAFEHTFTVVIPGYLTYFGQVAGDILYNAGGYIRYFVENYIVKTLEIVGAAYSVMDGYAESFINPNVNLDERLAKLDDVLNKEYKLDITPIASMPDLDWQLTQTETFLLDEIERLNKVIAKEFETSFENSLDGINRAMADFKLDAKVNLVPQLDSAAAATAAAITQETKVNQAFESRVMVRGPSDDPMTKLLGIQEKMLEVLRQKSIDDERSKVDKLMSTAMPADFEISIEGGF